MIDKPIKKIIKILASVVIGAIASYFLQFVIIMLPTEIALIFRGLFWQILVVFAISTGLLLGVWVKDDIKGKFFYGFLTSLLAIPGILMSSIIFYPLG